MPEFWVNYKNQFKTKEALTFEHTPIIVFDTETTGVNIENDQLLSIGAVKLVNDTIDLNDTFEMHVKSELFNPDAVEIHGLRQSGDYEQMDEPQAIEAFVNYIGNSVLLAHHAAFDVAMINKSLKKMGLNGLKNKVLDTGILYKKLEGVEQKHFALDELLNQFNIPAHDRHTATGDAYLTALVYFKIVNQLKKERQTTLPDLFIQRKTYNYF